MASNVRSVSKNFFNAPAHLEFFKPSAGNSLPRCQPIHCSPLFDFEQLLRESTETELMLLTAEEEGLTTKSCAALPDAESAETCVLTKGMLAPHNQPAKRKAEKPLSRGHKRRRQRREDLFHEKGYVPRSDVLEKYIRPATPVATALDLSTIPANNGAYSAKQRAISSPACKHDVLGLVAEGFELLQWDGL